MTRKENLSERLDRIVEAVLRREPASDRGASDAELAGLAAIAEDLRGLPRGAFRMALGSSLKETIAPHGLREAARDLPQGELRRLGNFDHATIGLFSFSGRGPWERHPGGDELIVVLDGAGEVTVLTETGPIRAELKPGSLFVCPRGLWHRPVATPTMTALYITPLHGGEHSWADDPRAT